MLICIEFELERGGGVVVIPKAGLGFLLLVLLIWWEAREGHLMKERKKEVSRDYCMHCAAI